MKYKTLYYNVEPIAKRLPDDCLKLIIQYAYDESKYNEWFQTIPHVNQTKDHTYQLNYWKFTKSISYGSHYKHFMCHIPKNVSGLTRFEYIYFRYNKRHYYDTIWEIIYIPMLQIEYKYALFNKKRKYMIQLKGCVQKIE